MIIERHNTLQEDNIKYDNNIMLCLKLPELFIIQLGPKVYILPGI